MAKRKGQGKGFSLGGGGGTGLPGGAKGGLAGQLQAMQQQMLAAQEALGDKTVTVTAGGGAITVIMNGHQKLQSITIDPEVVNPEDVEMLQDLITAAVNEGLRMAKEMSEQEMAKITAGLNLPGMPKLF